MLFFIAHNNLAATEVLSYNLSLKATKAAIATHPHYKRYSYKISLKNVINSCTT